MNALEVAYGIESCTTDPLHKEAATLLRQQAEKINNLEQWQKRQLDVIESLKTKTLTLTDDEVEEFEWVLKKHFNFPTNEIVPNLDKIIKAILRKAQEK